eukprot:GHVT01034157.1.p1 GENE.GHVT01034157.1~~GHVT01034157.1.p1  ORF type:complete len:323 (+),score=58.48 GHVT01034157.1:1385-2353(+)
MSGCSNAKASPQLRRCFSTRLAPCLQAKARPRRQRGLNDMRPVNMEKVEADQMPRVLHPSFKVARDVGMNPGNKLNSLLALHIRRALEDADVPTLALLGRTFACPGRPFTGDMREDTIDLFLRRIVNFPARHLSPCLPSLSSALAWAVSYPHRVDGSVSVVPLNPAQTSCCWQLLSDACKWLLVGPENFAATGTRPTAHGAEEPGKLPQQQSGHAGADTGGETSKPGLPSATEQQPSEDSILARLHPDELERFRDPEAYLGTPNQLARPLRIVNAIKTREKLNPEQLQVAVCESRVLALLLSNFSRALTFDCQQLSTPKHKR